MPLAKEFLVFKFYNAVYQIHIVSPYNLPYVYLIVLLLFFTSMFLYGVILKEHNLFWNNSLFVGRVGT